MATRSERKPAWGSVMSNQEILLNISNCLPFSHGNPLSNGAKATGVRVRGKQTVPANPSRLGGTRRPQLASPAPIILDDMEPRSQKHDLVLKPLFFYKSRGCAMPAPVLRAALHCSSATVRPAHCGHFSRVLRAS